MAHDEEQAMELEALEAIFPDHLEEFDGNLPDGWSRHGKTWAITIHPSADVADDDEPEDEPELAMQLVFAHTPTYPDEPPCIRLRSVRGLSDAELAEATAELQRHIEESLGMAMIYNLVTAAQEWLATRQAAGPGAAGELDPEAEEKRRREEEEAARAAARAHGHPVTVEAFNEWKARYDAERKAAAAEAAGSGKAADGREGRMTGKAWFLAQMAAGRGESSGSEAGEEDDEEDALGDGQDYGGAARGDGDGDGDGEDEEDFHPSDEDEDDEDDMLDDYLAAAKDKGG